MRSWVLTGHERPLTFVQLNKDGDLLFTCGKDGVLNGYLLRSKRKLGKYKTVPGVVGCCDVSLDSTRLIATSHDSKLFIYDVETSRILLQVKESGPVGFAEWCRCPDRQDRFVLSHDKIGEKVASIKVYEIKDFSQNMTGEWAADCTSKMTDYDSKCTRVHWGPFDETLISAHDNGQVKIWSAENGQLLRTIEAHKKAVTDLTFTTDRLLMLTASHDQTGKLYETINYNVVQTYEADRPLNSCSISPLWNNENKKKPHVLCVDT
eukprot:Lankesteria_metandrocarpae@DN3594_c0_g1_i1.p1